MSVAAVSIVLPVYNRLPFLRDSVASVFAQTFSDWELVIADDGSDAATREYLRSLDDPRVTVLWLAHDGRPGAVRNAALAAARGRYVAFLDSDDTWQPEKLARQIAAMHSHPERRWSYTGYHCIDAHGAPLTHQWTAFDGAIFADILTMRAHLALPTVIAERTLLIEAGGFDAAQVQHGDLELWLRLALRSDVLLVDQRLTSVRNHREHFTRGGLWALRWKQRMFEKIEPLATNARLARLVRAARARNAGDLMRVQASNGEPGEALRTFRGSVVLGWWRPRWWACVARAAVSAATQRAAAPRVTA